MNSNNISYICNKLLEIDWIPKIQENAMYILDKCDTKLEIMFLLGAFYFLEKASQKANNTSVGEYPVDICSVYHLNEKYEGYCFREVWPLWYAEIGEDCGPQSILFVPQVKFADNYHHDFGIFYGNENYSSDSWHLKYGVEVDGYNSHKDRRKKDVYRDTLVGHAVIRLLEEIHNPLKWFRIIMLKDDEYFYERIENNG